MSDNWVVQNLENALNTWNEKLAEIWQLITMGPESFRGGSIWAVIMNIHGAMQAIGYALLVLFFCGWRYEDSGQLCGIKRPEHAFKLFIRFVLAKALIDFGLELLMAIFNIVQGTIGSAMSASGLSAASATALPAEIITKINEVGFWDRGGAKSAGYGDLRNAFPFFQLWSCFPKPHISDILDNWEPVYAVEHMTEMIKRISELCRQCPGVQIFFQMLVNKLSAVLHVFFVTHRFIISFLS